ncbi:MAG: glycosyltransferase [Acetobacter papayae]|uniref:glycosyltransferase n=1 Tax=Acetobacter papayae TaxID=1076592 RepID=UPI0039E821A6
MESRTIGARFVPLLTYMQRHDLLVWEQLSETAIDSDSLRRFDAVLFNKHVSNQSLSIMRLANELGLHTIYDLDDWLLDLPSWSVLEMNAGFVDNVTSMIREASVATASNHILEEKMRQLRHSSVVIVPNGFDHQSFDLSPGHWQEKTPPKIIFSNLDGVKLINFRAQFFSGLSQVVEKNPQLKIDFWGDAFPEMHDLPNLVHRGSLANIEYKKAIRDEGYLFGIVPLGAEEDPDTFFFNSCKSAIKYVDYGSLGIPAIYSDCPTYRGTISHRVTGYIAQNNAQAWAQAFDEMLTSSQLRNTIRKNAFEDVHKRFTVEHISKMFLRALPQNISQG